MESLRNALLITLVLISYLLYQAWMKDHAPAVTATTVAEPAAQHAAAETPPADNDLPTAAPANNTLESDADAAAEPVTQVVDDTPKLSGKRVRVTTDVLDLVIDTRGADIKIADLTQYPVDKQNPDHVIRLLDDARGNIQVLQSGLRGAGGVAAPDHTAIYQIDGERFDMGDGESMVLVFTWQDGKGMEVEKRYTFQRGRYDIELEILVRNGSAQDWRGDSYAQLKRQRPPLERSMFNPESFSYTGPALYDGEKYEKLDIDDLTSESLNLNTRGGWTAILQHYFLSGLIPEPSQAVRFYGSAQSVVEYRVGYITPTLVVAPGTEAGFSHTLFIGPKLQKQLEQIAPGLKLAVDYGFLTVIAAPLFWLLGAIHNLIGNWGWAIILVTFLIKVLFYKPSEISGRSMAKMRKIQPRMQALRERYGDDREKLNIAMMDMYRKEKINPAAGCLPILIQMPVFLALYWVLLESVELRQAPFALWLNDLSTKDPYFILPLLMGAAMYVQTKLNPAPPDPIQQRIMMMMPIMMVMFSAFMPSGLVLYWVVNTVLSLAQQWQINRVVERQGDRRKPKKD